MITEVALLVLVALPLLIAAYVDWRADRDERRRMPVATLRALPLRANRRRA